MNGRYTSCAAAIALAAAPADARGPDEDTEFWSTVTATGAVKGPVLGSFELSIRADDRGTRAPTTLIRSAIGYQVAKPVSVWLGYARVDTPPSGGASVGENRWFQQVSWNLGAIGPAALGSRTRLEQRRVERARETGWRFRQQLRATAPLNDRGLSAVLSSEAFVALNSTDFGAADGLDQWRNFAGVNVAATNQVFIEVGYLNRYIRRRGARDRMDYIVPVTLGVRF